MAGASKRSPSGTVQDKKIRSSVRGTLGWDSKTYTRFLHGMAISERRLLCNSYGKVCDVMEHRYTQWSSNLMLEWDGSWKKSSYISAYEPSEAPQEVQELAEHRMAYLDLLYERLPSIERKMYGELLSPAFLADGCMPDVKAVYVLYKLQDLIRVELDWIGRKELWPQQRGLLHGDLNVIELAVREVDKALGSLTDFPVENKDSLFARLMLNTAVNRCCLELGEMSRLAHQVEQGMLALVHHLRQVYGDTLPKPKAMHEVREDVAHAMQRAGQTRWRHFKGQALDKVLRRAELLAETDMYMKQFPEAVPYRWRYVLLTSLAVAWSYCTFDTFDTRIVKDEHRKRQVISLRSREAIEDYPPGLVLYHRRQFRLLWQSEQMYALDPEKLMQEHLEQQYLRDTQQTYFCKFKRYTLRQWADLEIALCRLLEGSGWDKVAPLVEKAVPVS
jgi:hypothetical protein